MKWSQLKKRIESCLAESVRDRITFGSTTYRKAHDELGRGWIAIDKQEILNMASITFDFEVYSRDRAARENHEKLAEELHEKCIFAQWDLHRSLFEYLNLSIHEILHSYNPLIRAIGMLDARVGKRRLKGIDVSYENELVKRLFYLRCEAENIAVGNGQLQVDLTSRINPKLSWSQAKDDEKQERQQHAITKLGNAKATRRLQGLILGIYRRKISEDELDTEISREIFNGFENASDREILCQSLLFVESKSKLLKTSMHTRGVIALTQEATRWIRPLEQWIPLSHNPDRQFSSLARHLWTIYDVPDFMDNAWLGGNPIQQYWFKHLGAGKNIRTADHLPIPLTKKMAHYFMLAPAHYPIEAAFRWAQVHALEGNRRIADALLETRLIHDFRDNDFWLSALRFFIRNPMLDPVHISPIIDYIWNQRYEPRIVFVERGVAEEAGPEQPCFSMKGRTVASLLAAVDRWHRQLGKETNGGQFQWRKSIIQDYTFVEGTKRSKNMKVWRIRELLSSQELLAEGRQMKHCVATYANSCHRGASTIWTMDIETEEGIEKLLTIEVYPVTKSIRQARGKFNRRPTDKERDVLKRWAQQEGLEIASYV